ncbi:matrixin family metalloprotease [Duganella sp. FT94W]|uniref:Matrixin family metalloprotease n=1 Tax=Duganella lactea TaxID=2692173 RepID=A0ABW9VD15_9BURK|nr:matrixin family metalloprotease [Duganella lactea]MYM37529.1 matrixin family metalloprotease [Duganella lactea]
MYYVLTDDSGQDHSFGWAPDESHQGNPIAPGAVYTNDDSNYQPLTYSASSVSISQAQYDTLMGFGTPGSANYLEGMSSTYNILTNSCVDFTWKAMEQIGVEQPAHIPGTELVPVWNAKNVDTALESFARTNNEDFDSDPGDGTYGDSGGYGDYGAYGAYGYGAYGGYGGDYGGGFGFAGKAPKVAAAGNTISKLTRQDAASGEIQAAVATELELHHIYQLSTGGDQAAGAAAVVYEAAQFDHQVVTWSLASGKGTKAAPFSDYMSPANEAAVRAAFGAWAAAAPGITFQEVDDSSQADIRVGYGQFDTADSGIIGYTSLQKQNGVIQSNTIVRVEDPNQLALTQNADGQATYSGTDVTLTQALMHEIGHALGLGDNADPNSIMYYGLSSTNASLDATDLAGMNALYGKNAAAPRTAASASTSVNQLIQAMSSFDPPSAGAVALAPPAVDNKAVIAASAVAHS